MPLEITVDTPTQVQASPFITLRGSRSADVIVVDINSSSQGTRYPTNFTWEKDLTLAKGRNDFQIQGKDAFNKRTTTLTTTITVPDTETTTFSIFNPLDEYGLLLNIKRRPGEKNLHYRNRLQSVQTDLGGTTYRFLIEGLRRDLCIRKREEVLTISLVENATTGLTQSKEVFAELDATRIVFDCAAFRKDNQPLRLDPGSREAALDEELRSDRDLLLLTRGGSEVRSEDVEVLDDKRTLRVHGSWPDHLLATYRYTKSIDWDSYTTLTDVVNRINVLQGENGVRVFSAVTTNGSLLSKYLIRTPRTLITLDQPLTLNHTYVRVIEAWDTRYHDSLLDNDGLYFNTKLEKFAKTLQQASGIFMKDTVLDRSRVLSPGVSRTFSVLPHKADPRYGYYRCPDPTDTKKYTYWDWKAHNRKCPNHATYTLEFVGNSYIDTENGIGSDLQAVDVTEV